MTTKPRADKWRLAHAMITFAVLAVQIWVIRFAFGPIAAVVLATVTIVIVMLAPHRYWWAFLIGLGGAPTVVIALLLFAGSAIWDGSKPVTFTIRVIDRATGLAVPGARVTVVPPRPFGGDPVSSTVDSMGRIQLTARITASGRTGLSENSGIVILGFSILQVEALGFDTLREPLSLYGGRSRDIHSPTPPPFTVALDSMFAAADGPLSGIAGQYVANDQNQFRSLSISADGRFRFSFCYDVTRERCEGTVVLHDDELRLTSTKPTRHLPISLQVTRDGPRLYLCRSTDLRHFASRVKDVEKSELPPRDGILIREGDWKKPTDDEEGAEQVDGVLAPK